MTAARSTGRPSRGSRAPVDPWPEEQPSAAALDALRDAAPVAYWLDHLPPRDSESSLSGPIETDLCIVGGGFTGLWAALAAKEADPRREVVLLESGRVGEGPSGRNGGFVDASVTHGAEQALTHFGEEAPTLEKLGEENFRSLIADIEMYGIDADLEQNGVLLPSLAPHQDAWIDEGAELARKLGHRFEVFADAADMQAEVASPTYRRGLWMQDFKALADPARLATGLLSAALRQGVRVFEGTPAQRIDDSASALKIATPAGSVSARHLLLATGAYPSLVRSTRKYVVPVYDYALMTEPLSAVHLASIGWKRRQGIFDGGNRFHYYRLSKDNRILWGGYDAVYRFRGPVRPELDQCPEVFGRLSQHFFRTFPQLEGVRFSHRWGGPIDTCSRFSVFFERAFAGRAVSVLGYTGLGVGASRFGARVAVDLLAGRDTEATTTRFVNTRPTPFPPEPLRTAVIQYTRNRLAAADRNGGRRGAWLRLLDRLGLGFDS